MIVIVDYGAGNLRSVANAVAKLGYQARLTSSPVEVLNAQAVILPGVGAADTMKNLKALGLTGPLRQLIIKGRPFLGVCMGLQILFTGTEEGGGHECLGIIPGRVRRLPLGLKIPHMGWNQVKQRTSHSETVSVPVIASGGAGALEDLYQALVLGKADAVLAASIFHYETYSIGETKDYLAKRGIPIRIQKREGGKNGKKKQRRRQRICPQDGQRT